MHLFHLIAYITSIISVTHVQSITCPAGSESETIFLDTINYMCYEDGGAQICDDSQHAISRDQCPAVQEDNGWSFSNVPLTDCSKINWYFQGALNDAESQNVFRNWNLCPTIDIITPTGDNLSGGISLSCLSEIEFNITGQALDSSGLYLQIYTTTQGDVNGYTDVGAPNAWYRSRIMVPAGNMDPDGFGIWAEPTTITVTFPEDAEISNTNAPDITTIFATEEIRAISIQTNSDAGVAGENNFTMHSFTVRYDEGCTCPLERIFDLRRVDATTVGIGDEIGTECTDDIGTCNDCTCKQMCVHQNGITNGTQKLTNVESQADCCAVCSCIASCEAYTYIISDQAINSECSAAGGAAVGDCILYSDKLEEGCHEGDSLQYDAVSGSVIDGICDTNFDCCTDIGECVMGMCSAPTVGPTLVPTTGTNGPTTSPTGSESAEPEESSESSEPIIEPESEESSDQPTTNNIVSDSSSSDSGDDALFNGRVGDKYKKNNGIIENENKIENEIDMNVDLSGYTWINVWTIFGIIVIVNVVLIWMYYRRNKGTPMLPL